MKGFIRILESIIASIIILSSVTFFFSSDVEKLGWDETGVKIEVGDSIESVYKNGNLVAYVRDNDADGISKELSSIIRKNIDFSILITGIPNRDILVSCLCTDDEKQELEDILSPKEFRYHGRNIRIGIEKADISQNTIIMKPETQVLMFFGYKDMNPFRNQLEEFLSAGGSIFMLADLSSSQVDDGYIDETFGLAWDGSGGASQVGEFYGEDWPANISFRVSKYYFNFSGVEETFKDFHKGNDINKIAIDDNTIIIDQGNKFSFMKANSIFVRGRTLWSADYDRPEGNTSLLIKSALMWSSGESYRLDTVPKNIPQVNSKSGIVVYDNDPYEFVVNYWNIF